MEWNEEDDGALRETRASWNIAGGEWEKEDAPSHELADKNIVWTVNRPVTVTGRYTSLVPIGGNFEQFFSWRVRRDLGFSLIKACSVFSNTTKTPLLLCRSPICHLVCFTPLRPTGWLKYSQRRVYDLSPKKVLKNYCQNNVLGILFLITRIGGKKLLACLVHIYHPKNFN